MKRAPIIAKVATTPSPQNVADAPAAPMVDSLIARVSAMAKGNTITLPVCGRDVRFTLETISTDKIEESTYVWGGNERDQELLTQDALDDLIPSFLLSGQQNPAFGRKVSDIIEVADGSRRRMTAILTGSEYRILTGDLDDEQMDALCKIGNDYRPTSAYERGKRYSHMLENTYGGNVSALAEAENISRKVIIRCINTSKLPREIVALFSHPGELSARAGDTLFKDFSDHAELILSQIEKMIARKAQGEKLEPEEILKQFKNAINNYLKPTSTTGAKQQYVPGAKSHYKGENLIISLNTTKVPQEVVKQIESILLALK